MFDCRIMLDVAVRVTNRVRRNFLGTSRVDIFPGTKMKNINKIKEIEAKGALVAISKIDTW